jgi:ABC-type uncharacterized transport system substrate-binding protein
LRADVVVVVDTTAPSYTQVAAAIAAELPPRRYRVTEIASSATDELAGLRDRAVTLIAVGSDAVAAARAQLPDKPLVFCQVVAPDMLVGDAQRTWGVHALPPLSLQLRSWRAIDPTLRTVALIVSDRHAALAIEAEQAARANATDLVVETSASDRETLYLFRRIAAEVDGLWLLPDSRALSPSALRELLGYAAAHGIGVLTFSDALLRRGALLSATSLPEDVAATVHGVVERVVAGETRGLAAVTPLSAATVEVNAAVAGELGLPAPPVTRWVTRETD